MLVVTVTMRPQPLRFMPGTAARVRYQAPLRLVRTNRSHISGSISSMPIFS